MNETTTDTERIGTATYSPEDNKLRLYPFARLDKPIYERVRAHGFIWSPKQELFVAPMWTPDREDLMNELCGEIGDEDKGLCERAEERADRFSEYSEKRQADADQAHKAVASIAEHIPLGQPILVGHHSERHARKDAERIENGMRRAVKMWEQSQYWEHRAQRAVAHARYLERPDVRARRIKKIEADKRKQERAKAEAEHLTRFWKGELFTKNSQTGERRPIEIKQENRAWLAELLGRMPACGVMVRGLDGQSWFSDWDILRPDEEHYKNCPQKTVAEVQEIALRLQAQEIERCNRWLAHYENRLAYEREMLKSEGGLASDKTGPEKGGAVKCWASHRGGWSYIVKVNRISVTVLDNWGNEGQRDGNHNFTRNIPFDKCAKMMSAAEVQAARDCGTLIEYGDKTGFCLRCGDADNLPKPSTPKAPDPDAEKFKAMSETLKAGVQVVTAPNLFPTPPELAAQMVELADIQAVHRILEPSAGTGNLLRAISDFTEQDDCSSVVAVEINPNLANRLAEGFPKTDVRRMDFLECNGDLGKFDRVLMNPPFDHGSDIAHVKHALSFLNPGGRLVAIVANGPRQQQQLKPLASEWIDLPRDTFKEQGTSVNTALVVINC